MLPRGAPAAPQGGPPGNTQGATTAHRQGTRSHRYVIQKDRRTRPAGPLRGPFLTPAQGLRPHTPACRREARRSAPSAPRCPRPGRSCAAQLEIRPSRGSQVTPDPVSTAVQASPPAPPGPSERGTATASDAGPPGTSRGTTRTHQGQPRRGCPRACLGRPVVAAWHSVVRTHAAVRPFVQRPGEARSAAYGRASALSGPV